MENHYLPEFHKNQIFRITFIVESILAIAANATIMVMLIKSKRLRKKSSSKCFLSLQTSHVLLGVITLFRMFLPKYMEAWIIVNNCILLELFFNIFFLNLEKVLAISFPFRHYVLRNSRFFEVLIIISWIITTSLALSKLAPFCRTRHTMFHILTGIVILTFIYLPLSNIVMMKTAKRHVSAINKTMVGVHQKVVIKHTKSIRTVFIVTMAFLVLWLPYLVHNILRIQQQVEIKKKFEFFRFISYFLALFNGIVDPLFIFLFNKDVKTLIRKTTSIRRRDNYIKDFYSKDKYKSCSLSSLT